MIRVKDITDELERIAPLRWQEGFDNAGMQVGNADREASTALLCLDVTEEVIDEAITKGCNLIISHHPLAFRPFKALTGSNYVERCIMKACKHDLCIYSAHTNMDNAPQGVNYLLAEKLGLENVRILSPEADKDGAGSGIMGILPKAVDPTDFLQNLKRIFNLHCLKHSRLPDKTVRNIAICGGSGAFLWPEAVLAGADVLLTGEAKYNDFFDVENRLMLVAIGHYESEVCTKELFHRIISEKFPTFALYFSNDNSNPVKYL
jgi:dinuclear metal center YbgI/SA1388 family protein